MHSLHKSEDQLNNRGKILVLFLCLGLASSLAYAQVTVGSAHKPLAGSLLDIKEADVQGANSNKGLLLPRVELKKLELLDMGDSSLRLDAQQHVGLLVYNIYQYDVTTIPPSRPISTKELICPGVHIWDGKLWQAAVPYRDKGSIRCDGKIPEITPPVDPEEPEEEITPP